MVRKGIYGEDPLQNSLMPSPVARASMANKGIYGDEPTQSQIPSLVARASTVKKGIYGGPGLRRATSHPHGVLGRPLSRRN